MYYFAYANLMDVDTMRGVAPSARMVSVACLRNYEFSFARCTDATKSGATLIPVEGAETWGVQYEMSDADMAALDKSAGISEGNWAQMSVVVHDAGGAELPTTTYFIPNPSGRAGPPAYYVGPTLAGARALDLPAEYLDKLTKLMTGVSTPAWPTN